MTKVASLRLFIVGIVILTAGLLPRNLPPQTSALPRTVNTLPPYSERWALVIGINKYEDPNLNPLYGQNDAAKIASDLEQYAGFEHDHIFLVTDDLEDVKKLI
jgi:hypothetical protein